MFDRRTCDCSKGVKYPDPLLKSNNLSNTVLNRPDIHQQIVSEYIKYSEQYWITVRKRQLKYLTNKRLKKEQEKQFELDLQKKQLEVEQKKQLELYNLLKKRCVAVVTTPKNEINIVKQVSNSSCFCRRH